METITLVGGAFLVLCFAYIVSTVWNIFLLIFTRETLPPTSKASSNNNPRKPREKVVEF